MKKNYEQPIIEVITIKVEDVITTSGYDPDGLLNNTKFDNWFND